MQLFNGLTIVETGITLFCLITVAAVLGILGDMWDEHNARKEFNKMEGKANAKKYFK